MSNANKNVVIIGASSSVGGDVVKHLIDDGYYVLATYNSHIPDSIGNGRFDAVKLDLSSFDEFDSFVDESIAALGKIDVIVFLAGVLPGKSVIDYSDSLMTEVMQINFISNAALIRRIKPYFADQAQAIFVSSISGARGSFDPIYAASKAAQNAFVKSLATWHAPSLRVNAIAPALIEGSDMFLMMDEDRREYHLSQTPTGQLTSKSQIAGVISDLCGSSWGNLNGQIIHINGGVYV